MQKQSIVIKHLQAILGVTTEKIIQHLLIASSSSPANSCSILIQLKHPQQILDSFLLVVGHFRGNTLSQTNQERSIFIKQLLIRRIWEFQQDLTSFVWIAFELGAVKFFSMAVKQKYLIS